MKWAFFVIALGLLVACGGALATSPSNKVATPTVQSEDDQRYQDARATDTIREAQQEATARAIRHEIDLLRDHIADGQILQSEFEDCVDFWNGTKTYPKPTAVVVSSHCEEVDKQYHGPIIVTAVAAKTALASKPRP